MKDIGQRCFADAPFAEDDSVARSLDGYVLEPLDRVLATRKLR